MNKIFEIYDKNDDLIINNNNINYNNIKNINNYQLSYFRINQFKSIDLNKFIIY